MVTIGMSSWPAESEKKIGKIFLSMPGYTYSIKMASDVSTSMRMLGLE
ncbi:hypothetical protein DSCOOX_12750 [Desulfosarcina ovata subsp. ovata]|uniref:Uncharacterized protein n=1 Tax=Desulfosarcina ovata subsp. ovata TaxID=2752305 RepID=A0A5K8A6D9_9BACT|nr:hypothetical protein DSCOOX_12750 [Desulfosarcina ovata subsp. ovata]